MIDALLVLIVLNFNRLDVYIKKILQVKLKVLFFFPEKNFITIVSAFYNLCKTQTCWKMPTPTGQEDEILLLTSYHFICH